MRFFRSLALVLTTALVGFGLGYLAAYKTPPSFASNARLLVIDTSWADVGADDRVQHVEAVLNRVTCERAITAGNLASFECLRTAVDPVPALQSRLQATALDQRGSVIELRFVAARRNEPSAVLQAMIQAYRQLLGDDLPAASAETLQKINLARSELHAELTQREAALAQWLASPPASWRGIDDAESQRRRLAETQRTYQEITLILETEKKRLAALKSSNSLPSVAGAPTTRASASAMSPPITRSAELDNLIAEESKLLKKYGENHPQVKAIRGRIEAALANAGEESPETRLRAEETRLLAQYGPAHPRVRQVRAKLLELSAEPRDGDSTVPASLGEIGSVSADPAVRRQNLEREISRWEEAIKQLEPQLQVRRSEVRVLDDFQLREKQLRDEIDRLQRLFDAAVIRLKYLRDRQGEPIKRLMVLQPPTEGELVPRNAWIDASIGSAFGAAVGLLVIGIQTLTPAQVAAPSAPKLLAQIPTDLLPPVTLRRPRQAGESLVVVKEPAKPLAELFRHLRVSIEFAAPRATKPGLGFVTEVWTEAAVDIVANTAASLALSGARVLLVDMTEEGCLGRRWDMPLRATLQAAAAGTAEFVDAVVTTDITNFHLASWTYPGKDLPDEATPTSDGLVVLHERYDYLCIMTSLRQIAAAPGVFRSMVDAWVVLAENAEAANAVLPHLDHIGPESARIIGAVLVPIRAEHTSDQSS